MAHLNHTMATVKRNWSKDYDLLKAIRERIKHGNFIEFKMYLLPGILTKELPIINDTSLDLTPQGMALLLP